MNNTTTIAVLILGGIFLLMTVTLLKYGVEAAIKLWGGMGALTGVAFGSIISYYFTNKSNEQEIRQAQIEKHAAVSALTNAQLTASEVNKEVKMFVSAIREKNDLSRNSSGNKERLTLIPSIENTALADRLERASMQLSSITTLNPASGGYTTVPATYPAATASASVNQSKTNEAK